MDCTQPEITGNISIPQASINTHLRFINCLVVPEYRFLKIADKMNNLSICSQWLNILSQDVTNFTTEDIKSSNYKGH